MLQKIFLKKSLKNVFSWHFSQPTKIPLWGTFSNPPSLNFGSDEAVELQLVQYVLGSILLLQFRNLKTCFIDFSTNFLLNIEITRLLSSLNHDRLQRDKVTMNDGIPFHFRCLSFWSQSRSAMIGREVNSASRAHAIVLNFPSQLYLTSFQTSLMEHRVNFLQWENTPAVGTFNSINEWRK